MGSSIAGVDRLDALDAEIDDLEAKLLDAQRNAGDLLGDDAEAARGEALAKILEWQLADRLRLSQRLNRAFRDQARRAA
jgi:hypothetical protein